MIIKLKNWTWHRNFHINPNEYGKAGNGHKNFQGTKITFVIKPYKKMQTFEGFYKLLMVLRGGRRRRIDHQYIKGY